MMRCYQLFFVFIINFLFTVCLSGYAQSSPTKNKKVDAWYQKAILYEMRQQPEQAIAYYQKSIAKNPNHYLVYQALAHLYSQQMKYEEAAHVLEKGIAMSHNHSYDAYRQLAEAWFKSRQYTKALTTLNKIGFPPKENQQAYFKHLLLSRSIQFAGSQPLNKETKVSNMGDRINSKFNDFFPSISKSDSVLVFTRETQGVDQDFYLAMRDSCGGWFLSKPLGSPPNSPQQEGAQMISADGHYLFFMRCENRSPNGWALGGCDLYFSYTEGDNWSQPTPFGATINTPAFEGMPSLSPDNRTLYFVSDREGGYGGKDIWMSRFEDGLWQIPENLGPEINTPGDETAPWMAVDNHSLYFTSNGHPSFGGHDLYVTRRNEYGDWSTPENLGAGINTTADEVSLTLSNDGLTAYFASNRVSGFGGMDIYETKLPGHLRAYPQSFLTGVVRDSLSGSLLPNALMRWTDVATGEEIGRYMSNKGDASYIAPFPVGRKLALEVNRYFYLTYRDTFYFENPTVFPPDTMNISLLPEDYNPPLNDTLLLTLFYSKNEVTLEDSLKRLLEKIVLPYKGKKFHELKVYGFTDISGYKELNDQVSFSRARFVKEALLKLGFEAEQISIQGWGDSSPMASNLTEEGRAQNRRVEIILTKPE